MMVKVLIYAYATGTFSSRAVARKLEEDVAFRMLAAGNFPQHRTVCEFRRRHLAEFSELFVGVVQVAREMGQSQASLAAKWCLEFLILTAVRSGEARGAARSEIDMDAATWTVPASRMKANAEHRVPLCGRALEILEEARAIDDGSGLVFPSPSLPGRPLSDMTLTALLRRIGVADRATVHGFRSSFRDFAAECTNARIRGHGAEPCPRCRQRSCGGLRALRSVRTPPWAHGPVGGLPGRGHWACRADGPGA